MKLIAPPGQGCARATFAPARKPGLLTKTVLVMKLTMMLLSLALFASASDGMSQSITLNTKNSTVEEVISIVEKQAKLVFVYKKDLLTNAPKVSITASNMPVAQFLELAFKNQAFTFSIENQTVVLIRNKKADDGLKDLLINVPRVSVRGRVIDENGKPVIATVTVKGSNKAVSTNDNGEFELTDVDGQAILEISGANIITFEVKVNGRTNIATVTAKLKIAVMEDVVINTGYQTISRERSAGAAAKVDMSVVASRSSSTNILQRLDGLVPGLVLNNAPDAEGILLRGLTSINSTRSPLVIVDGVELQAGVGNINPQDVADITILKDATAASIWGAKASNGVIVITTKKGRPGEKIRVQYDGFYNFQGRPDLDYIPRFNSQQFIQFNKEVFPQYAPSNTWPGVKLSAAVPPHMQIQYDRYRGVISQAQADRALDSLAGIDNRGEIRDIFYRNAATTNHTVSVSGGGKIHSFYGSASYTGIQSSTPGEKNNSFKVNLRQDFNFNRRLQLSLITDLTNTVTSTTNLGNPDGINAPGTGFVPYQHFRDENGNPLPVHYMGGFSDSLRMNYQARSRVNLGYVPLDEINNGYSKGNALAGRIVAGAKLNLFKGLRFEGTYGYYASSAENRSVLYQQSYTVRNELATFTQAPTVNSIPRYWLPENGGRLTLRNESQKNWTVRNQLVFDQSWNDHQLTVLAGQEATSASPIATTVIYRGWDDQLQIARPVNYDTLAKGITGTVTGGNANLPYDAVGGEGIVSRTTSYYSNLSYSYLTKYAFNASWRIDRSNLFGFDKSAQNRPVWSVGGKWMMGNEDFMNGLSWLNRLDMRLTYGITGNAPQPGQAASFDILIADAQANYVTGAGIIINTPANRRLTWEGTTVYNAGLDFTMFNGRLGGAIDLYLKKTKDLIGDLNTAPLTGYPSVTGNFGDLENKGVELSLNSINVKSKDILWTTSFNLAYNKNKITRLAVVMPVTTGAAMIDRRFMVDYPAFTMFAYDYAGLNEYGDPQIRQADGKVTADATVSKAEDVKYMGTSQPLWTGGLMNSVHYKGFQLGINISYSMGHHFFRDGNSYWESVIYSNSMHPEFANRWKVAGDENKTDIPRFAGTNAIAGNRNTSYYTYANTRVFDASFAKIREITLSYSLPENMIRRIAAQDVTFRVQVSNLMLWKANDLGIDPEFHYYGGSRSVRTGQGTITIGANISF